MLNGSSYATFPPEIASFDAMTIAGWVYWNGGGAWQRIFDFGDGTAKLYINGAEVASSAELKIKPSDFKPVVNTIGRSQYDADPLFHGRVDDFRIYNHVLSTEEIETLAGPEREDLQPEPEEPEPQGD